MHPVHKGMDKLELKFKLSNYSNMFTGLTQKDASESLMWLFDILCI